MTGLAVVGGAMLVGFKFTGLNADRVRVASLKEQTQNESSVKEQLAKSLQNLEEARARLTHLERGIPGTAYIPTMLQELEKTGKASGIAVTGIRPVPRAVAANTSAAGSDSGEVLSKPAYEEIGIEVKGRGKYAAAMKFVQALQAFPKIVSVHTIDITPSMDQKEAASGSVEITVGLTAYLFKDDKKSGDSDPNAYNGGDATAKPKPSPNAAAPMKSNSKGVVEA
jgi:Tfp pilus assembly protein PilO